MALVPGVRLGHYEVLASPHRRPVGGTVMPALAALLLLPTVAAQEAASPAPQFGVEAARVVVDVVVRDKAGRTVRDLAADEVEVYEDGVLQGIESFRMLGPGTRPREGRSVAVAEPEAEAASAPVPERGEYLALVFDRLGLEARQLVGRAFRDRYGRGGEMAQQVGVFLIDRGLGLVEPFTTDSTRVLRAVERVVGLQGDLYASVRDGERVRELKQKLVQAGTNPDLPAAARENDVVTAPTGVSPSPGGGPGAMAEIRRLQMEFSMLTAFGDLEADIQASTAFRGLVSILSALERLPGRKAVVYFSEAFAITRNLEPAFRTLTAAATRAGVSIYTVDAAGLRLVSAAQAALAVNSYIPAEALAQGVDRGLERLARDTGGYAVRDTNDFGRGLARVEEDLGASYQLAYTPSNATCDGRFRSIEVKVRRPHGLVQARRGYYAVRTITPTPLLEHEAPALARLEGGAWPRELEVAAGALQFPEEPGEARVAVLAEIPEGDLTFERDENEKAFRQDFTVLALVKDGGGRVVRKLSQRYQLSVSPGELVRARAAKVLHYKETFLPPGSYDVEIVVYDAKSGRAGTGRMDLDVPRAETGHPRLSSLFVIDRAEWLDEAETKNPRPLHYGDTVLYPNLGWPLRREGGSGLAFFLATWPADSDGAAEVLAELRRGADVVRRARAALPKAEPFGRAALVATLPVDGLEPGPYELQVTVSAGPDGVVRTTSFTLER